MNINNNNNNNYKSNGDKMKEMDKEIDRSGDKDRIRERDGLRSEGVELLLASEILMGSVLLLVNDLDILIMMEKTGAVEKMDFEERERWYNSVEVTNNNLEKVRGVVREMEEKYNNLRVRVNKFYGYEVMIDNNEMVNYKNFIDGTPGEDGESDGKNKGKGKDKPKGKGDDDDGEIAGGKGDSGFNFNIGDDGEGFKEGNADWWKN
jgi:hypothetical protein